MKKNNLLKTVLLLVFSVFLLQSCRTDIENNGQKTVSEQPYSKLITLDNLNIELSSNTTFQKSKVSSIIQEKTLSNENFKLADDNYSKDFITSIDTKNIVKVEKSNGLTTYTLNVKTKDNSKERHFYQLILIAQNNNFDYRLIKYIPSDDFNVSNIKTENFKGEIIAYNIDGLPNDGSIKMGRMGISNSIQNCATIAYIEKVWAKCSIHGYYSPKPEYGCEGGHWEYDLVISTSCDGGGIDVPPPSGWDYGSPSAGDTGGGLSGGSGSYNGGIPTDPTYILAADLIINVIPDLSLSAQNFLYTHPDIADVLAQQLVGSPVAQDKIDFVSWAANFFSQNPNISWTQFQNWFVEGDQDFNRDLLKMIVENNHKIPQYTSSDFPGMNNGMPYNWWNDENYLNNMSLGFNNINLTKEEKKMCALFPLAAVMIFSNKDIALNEASSTFPNQIPHNNKADAFRHAFFNALNTRDVYSQFSTRGTFTFAKNIVRMFGIAHESEVPQELLLEKAMDLYNNEGGIEVCSTCNPLTNPTNLVKGYVLSLLNEGKLVHIWPLNNDQTIRPDSNIYPTNQH
ncbi:MAG: DUF6973 domain-containing protein [Cloacibacterium caeni]